MESPATTDYIITSDYFDDQFHALTYGRASVNELVIKSNGIELRRHGKRPVAMIPAKLKLDGRCKYYIDIDMNESDYLDLDVAAIEALGEVMESSMIVRIRFISFTEEGMEAFFRVFSS